MPWKLCSCYFSKKGGSSKYLFKRSLNTNVLHIIQINRCKTFWKRVAIFLTLHYFLKQLFGCIISNKIQSVIGSTVISRFYIQVLFFISFFLLFCCLFFCFCRQNILQMDRRWDTAPSTNSTGWMDALWLWEWLTSCLHACLLSICTTTQTLHRCL